MRDPLYISPGPGRSGVFKLTEEKPSLGLHYEVRGPKDATDRVVMMMGAFMTKEWLRCVSEGCPCLWLAATHHYITVAACLIHSTSPSPNPYIHAVKSQTAWRETDSRCVSAPAPSSPQDCLLTHSRRTPLTPPPAHGAPLPPPQVLTFDHRLVGQSARASDPGAPLSEHHTSELLADDTWRLVEHVWGPHAAVHLYGVSMGGMVAQQVRGGGRGRWCCRHCQMRERPRV
jgi:pimeloyl-ACP methyl ester carboxylesterase